MNDIDAFKKSFTFNQINDFFENFSFLTGNVTCFGTLKTKYCKNIYLE